MGSSFGLYCEPHQRMMVSGPFERRDYISPLHEKIVPDLSTLPKFLQDALLNEFVERAYGFEPGKFEAARDWLIKTVADLLNAHLHIGFDAEEISVKAKRFAALSARLGEFNLINTLAQSFDLPMPIGTKQSTLITRAKRCHEARTWRRAMTTQWTRKAENHLRALGFVEKYAMLYVSDLGVQWYKGRLRCHEAAMRSTMIHDGEGTS